MKKLTLISVLLVIALFLGFISCKKESQEVTISNEVVENLDGLKTEIQTRSEELTTEEQEQLYRLRQTASIFFEVAKVSSARSEIISGVKSEFYEDESILFKDLFNSAQSPAFDFQTIQNTLSLFQAKLQNGQYLNSSEFGVTELNPSGDSFDLVSYLECNRMQVYWPYSENWAEETDVIPTITYLPISQDTINIGWKLIPGQLTFSYQEVVVDDDYAQENPVWIVNFYEGSKIDENCDYDITNRGGDYDPPIVGTDCERDFPQDRVQVDIGKVKFFKQYDGVFRGGPDFRFVRGIIILNANGNQITGVVPVFAPVNLKRKDKNKWKTKNELWDTNWEAALMDQFIAVYEEDHWTNTTITIGATVTVAAPPLTVQETANFQHSFQSKDEIIYNQQYDRCWYFVTSPLSTPFENVDGWNVRGTTGAVKWTMPYTIW